MPDDRYTHGHHDAVLRSHRSRTAANSAAHLLPRLDAGMRVLDIGCGPGTITADLAAIVAPGEVVALDRAPEVLAEAAAVAGERGLTNVTTVVGDVYDLDFDDAAFDVVHAHQLLQHLSDPVAALAEMGRVARSRGSVACRDADYAAMTWFPVDPLLDRWQEIYHRVAWANGAEPDAGRRLAAWARAAGLASITASASVWCYADAATCGWWGDLWAERMTGSAVAEQAVADGITDVGELAAVAAALRRWSVDPDAWFAVLHGEILATPG